MRTLFAFLILLAFIACNQPAEPPTATAPEQAQVEGQPIAESGEALGVTTIQAIKVNVSWGLSASFGARTVFGTTQVTTTAWTAPPVGGVVDPTILMRDLIRALTANGTLAGVDLTQTAKNYLVVFATQPTAARIDFVVDSRSLPQKPK